MQIYLGLAFILIVVSVILVLNLKLSDVTVFYNTFHKNKSLKKQVSLKGKSKLIILYEETLDMLTATGQKNKFYLILLSSSMLIVIGIFVGISLNNLFIAPILGFSFALLPFMYVRFQFIEYKKMLVEEMETALSIVTSSYERCENILLAFEENTENINEPVKSVFEKFILTLKETNTNPVIAINEMKTKIKHPVFIEWCENLKRCVDNRTLKVTLHPVVDKLTDMRIATNEARNILYSAKRECRMVLSISIFFMVLNFWIIPTALKVNVQSPIKNMLFAINVLVIIAGSIRALLLTKDISFEL